MLGSLDIRTLSLTLVLFCSLYAIGLFLSSLGQNRQLSTRLWAASIASEGAGFMFLGLREFISPFLSVVVANLLFIVAMVLTLRGIEAFRGRKWISPWIHATSLLLLLLLFLYFTYIDPNVNIRIIGISLLLAAQAWGCAWLFSHQSATPLPLSRWMAITVFVAFGGFMLLRSLWTITEAAIPDFMQAGSIHAVALLAFLLFVSGKAFSFVWLHNQEMNEALRILARTDGLTGVLNRRTLFEELERELERAGRHPRPLALVMLDIDHFKAINDRYGHSSGDKALVSLAGCLRHELRSLDLIGRFGGEEFVLVLPNVDCNTAVEITERIRARIESEPMRTPRGEFSITASFGIAILGIHGSDADTLTNAADAALYVAKSEGRNRVATATMGIIPESAPDHS